LPIGVKIVGPVHLLLGVQGVEKVAAEAADVVGRMVRLMFGSGYPRTATPGSEIAEFRLPVLKAVIPMGAGSVIGAVLGGLLVPWVPAVARR